MSDLTFGAKAVGLTFNPTANSDVEEIKTKAASFVDVICGENGEKVDFKTVDPEIGAMRKLAQRHAQEASMWAVKAATWGL